MTISPTLAPDPANAFAERFEQVITAFLPVIGLFQRWFQPYAFTVYSRFARARRRLTSVMARYAAGKLHRRASCAATGATALCPTAAPLARRKGDRLRSARALVHLPTPRDPPSRAERRFLPSALPLPKTSCSAFSSFI